MLNHEHYMRRAIDLAERTPQFPFGALIVDQVSGNVLSEGWNRSGKNPIWHGEIDAINRLAESEGDLWKDGNLVLYSTAEPCPMCQSAILWTGIELVVYGSSIRFLQGLGWRQIDILSQEIVDRTPFRSCKLIGGILAEECNASFAAAVQKQNKDNQ